MCNPISNKLVHEPKLVGYIDRADCNAFLKAGKNITTLHSTTNMWQPSTDISDHAVIRREGNRDC